MYGVWYWCSELKNPFIYKSTKFLQKCKSDYQINIELRKYSTNHVIIKHLQENIKYKER